MRHRGCLVAGILDRVAFYSDRKEFRPGEEYYN